VLMGRYSLLSAWILSRSQSQPGYGDKFSDATGNTEYQMTSNAFGGKVGCKLLWSTLT